MIIGFVNQQSGAGKTTMAVNLAMGLALRERRVLLVDADPKEALSPGQGRESLCPFPVIGLPRPIIRQELPKLTPNYDFIVIDGPRRSAT
jgi:chromosome partitioning protein